jgi:hypothetical protein
MSTTDPLEALARALQTGDDVAAEQAALALDPTAEGALIAWLGEADPERRWWAARSLAHCGEAAAASALLQLVDDPDPALRAVAAFALGHLHARCPEAVQPLLAALATHLADEAGAVRQAVADALALCGDAAVPALAAVLPMPCAKLPPCRPPLCSTVASTTPITWSTPTPMKGWKRWACWRPRWSRRPKWIRPLRNESIPHPTMS